MTNTHTTTIKNLEIRWGILYSALATVIASGLLLAKTPPALHPYVETFIGLVIAFHPSPVAITSQEVLDRLSALISTVEAIVPTKDKPIVEDAAAIARVAAPLLPVKESTSKT